MCISACPLELRSCRGCEHADIILSSRARVFRNTMTHFESLSVKACRGAENFSARNSPETRGEIIIYRRSFLLVYTRLLLLSSRALVLSDSTTYQESFAVKAHCGAEASERDFDPDVWKTLGNCEELTSVSFRHRIVCRMCAWIGESDSFRSFPWNPLVAHFAYKRFRGPQHIW